jgi:ubiquinol-cytochrome c reductase cytochrome b subunit
MGVIAIGLVFASLIALPFISVVQVGSPRFRILYERLFWVFVADVFLLTWLGAQEIMPSTVLLGQICTVIFFLYLLVILPFLGWLETSLILNK